MTSTSRARHGSPCRQSHLVVVPLLGRRRFPFYAPAAVWLLAAAVSLADGWRRDPVSTSFAATRAFLLGNAGDGLQARLGLAFVLCGAVIVVGNKPGHARSELVFVPVMFAIAWAAGYALRERARHAEVAEQRAVHAEHERQAAARATAADERGRIARELHDTIAHAVSVMVLQVGAVRHQLPDAHQEHKNVLRDVEQTGRTALTDMRHSLDAMREDDGGVELAPQPGLDRLDGLLKEFGRAGLPSGQVSNSPVWRGRHLRLPNHPGGPHQRAQARAGDRSRGSAGLRSRSAAASRYATTARAPGTVTAAATASSGSASGSGFTTAR